MAVVDKYVNEDIANGDWVSSVLLTGAVSLEAVETFEIDAADSDGSVYRVFKGVPANAILNSLTIYNDAIASAADLDVGLYKTDSGEVVDQAAFISTLDLTSARDQNGGEIFLGSPDIADVNKSLREVAGETLDDMANAAYDIAITGNDVSGNAGGTVTVVAKFTRIV